MKIAVVKSSIYQDLWVSDITNDSFTLFKTSMMRCPPIGLAESYNADFIIVKDSKKFPCQFNKNVLPQECENNMKYSSTLKNPSLPFLDETYHNNISIDSVSHDAETIEWGKYTIVLCINTCIPCTVIEKYPNVLWCYWVGENEDELTRDLIGNYDIILNQDVTKQNLPPHSVGFPYSFLGSTTLETMAKSYFELNTVEKNGIYMEINNTQERPVVNIPTEFIHISNIINMPIHIHSQNIIENAKRLYKAKYYVKLFGRILRGNSILESVSAGTMILANRNLVVFNDLILPECHIETRDDVIIKILYYENNPLEYAHVIQKQRDILNERYFKQPIHNLIEKYKAKQLSNLLRNVNS